MTENDPNTQNTDKQYVGLGDMLKHPLVQELAIPYFKKEVLGIGHHDKELTKKGFGRVMYAMRDFLQGTWWVMALFTASMMIIFILYLVFRKVLGV